MASLYCTDSPRLSEEGVVLHEEFRALLYSRLRDLALEGYSVREVSHVLLSVVSEVESELALRVMVGRL